jgi:hypothetical protein
MALANTGGNEYYVNYWGNPTSSWVLASKPFAGTPAQSVLDGISCVSGVGVYCIGGVASNGATINTTSYDTNPFCLSISCRWHAASHPYPDIWPGSTSTALGTWPGKLGAAGLQCVDQPNNSTSDYVYCIGGYEAPNYWVYPVYETHSTLFYRTPTSTIDDKPWN